MRTLAAVALAFAIVGCGKKADGTASAASASASASAASGSAKALKPGGAERACFALEARALIVKCKHEPPAKEGSGIGETYSFRLHQEAGVGLIYDVPDETLFKKHAEAALTTCSNRAEHLIVDVKAQDAAEKQMICTAVQIPAE